MTTGYNATAVIILALVCGAFLTAPLAALLLWLFRRSLERGMIAGAVEQFHPGTRATAPDAVHANSAVAPLRIQVIDPGVRANSRSDGGQLLRSAELSLRSAVLAYALAGFAYALLFGIGWALQFPQGLRAWHRILDLSVLYFWPTVLAIALVAATTRVERFALPLFYFAVSAAVSVYMLAVSPKLTLRQLVVLWLITNGPATLLMLTFLRRRVRAVGPLVVAFVAVSVFGAAIAPGLFFRNDRSIHAAIVAGRAIALGGAGIYYAALVAGFLVFALISWWLLRRFAELYRQKKVGDQSLTIDSLFLVFAVEQSIAFDPSGIHIYAGAAAFIAYKAIITVALRYFRTRSAIGTPSPVLLHLRVFSLGRRSEDLFDGLTKLWRRIGSIVMIAGPDLIRTTVEPHEFLEFIGGKMSRRFVRGEADLNQRLTALDHNPDPDGRYRINQFFCHRDTWQMTMSALARQSSAVLMDLRSFSQRNQGCIFELAQLVGSIDLAGVVFVIDSTTDRQFLEQTLKYLWERIPANSPNARATEPTARFFVERRGRISGARLLLRELLSQTIAVKTESSTVASVFS